MLPLTTAERIRLYMHVIRLLHISFLPWLSYIVRLRSFRFPGATALQCNTAHTQRATVGKYCTNTPASCDPCKRRILIIMPELFQGLQKNHCLQSASSQELNLIYYKHISNAASDFLTI